MALLGLLDREPSHGYDLKRDYDAYFGRGRPLPFGQVYATLARLARDGKAVTGDAEPGAGPDRKRYTITQTGKYEVEAWLGEPIPAEFTEAERAALALTEEGTRLADAHHGVSDETWAQVRKHYDDDQIAALVSLVAMINATNRLAVIVRQKGGSYEPGMFTSMAS
jgi:DNA-binding PadR family transcriptional regulator